MRHVLIAALAVIAGLMVSAISSNAAPGPILAAPPVAVDGGMIEKVQIFPRRYNRRYGPYDVPPVVVVPPVVPVVPPIVVEEPVIVMPPPRPASCGEYRYWNGQYCVDARYNRPYLGPRP
jgi:hypothetical protein